MIEGTLYESSCSKLKFKAKGKVRKSITRAKHTFHSYQVRDIYEASEDSLLFLATDRLSAFDVVMKNGVPGKVSFVNPC